jgi:hypothetical protein
VVTLLRVRGLRGVRAILAVAVDPAGGRTLEDGLAWPDRKIETVNFIMSDFYEPHWVFATLCGPNSDDRCSLNVPETVIIQIYLI